MVASALTWGVRAVRWHHPKPGLHGSTPGYQRGCEWVPNRLQAALTRKVHYPGRRTAPPSIPGLTRWAVRRPG
eukprot:4436274-Alexandrium_andersonii.AAC.1